MLTSRQDKHTNILYYKVKYINEPMAGHAPIYVVEVKAVMQNKVISKVTLEVTLEVKIRPQVKG